MSRPNSISGLSEMTVDIGHGLNGTGDTSFSSDGSESDTIISPRKRLLTSSKKEEERGSLLTNDFKSEQHKDINARPSGMR